MKRTKPKGTACRWKVLMSDHSFTVIMEYENGKLKEVSYQFADYDDFMEQMRKFKRRQPSKELIQDVFDHYVHTNDYVPPQPRCLKKKCKREKKEKDLPLYGRGSQAYAEWRHAVLERDDHTCQMCGTMEHIEAHHKDIRYHEDPMNVDVNNGISLCHNCHIRFHGKRDK